MPKVMRRGAIWCFAICMVVSGSGSCSEIPSYEQLPADGAPQMFAPGIISTPDDESGGVFSPDGRDFYFSKQVSYTTAPRIGLLCVSHWARGQWTTPEVLPFSGRNFDSLPRLNADGTMLFFTSSRPIPGGKFRGLHIWQVELANEKWGEPQALPAPINTDDQNWNWGASVATDGTLYFASTRDGSGHARIFRSSLDKETAEYAEPVKLGAEINSEFDVFDPFISADGKTLFYVTAGDGGPPFAHPKEILYTGGFPYARGDIYVTTRHGEGWSKPQHLGPGVNTVADENSPALTPDGKHLIFTSERSPFVVPMPHALRYDELERGLHQIENGHGNIYSVPVSELKVKHDE